jgi:hypothetical protein
MSSYSSLSENRRLVLEFTEVTQRVSVLTGNSGQYSESRDGLTA